MSAIPAERAARADAARRAGKRSIYRDLEKRAIEVIDDRVDDDAPRAALAPIAVESTTDALSSSCARRPGIRS